MVRILCIGDSHVPNRAKDLPEQIYKQIDHLTQSELYDDIFFTGDLIKFPDLLDFLSLKSKRNLFKVLGNMDYYYGNRDLPTYQKLDILYENSEKLTIGLTHGSQIKPRGDYIQLEELAIQKKYNILVSGHTHKEEIFLTSKGILLINPGSVTGAWSFLASEIPSFVELFIDKRINKIHVNLFQLNRKTREFNNFLLHFIFKKGQIHKND